MTFYNLATLLMIISAVEGKTSMGDVMRRLSFPVPPMGEMMIHRPPDAVPPLAVPPIPSPCFLADGTIVSTGYKGKGAGRNWCNTVTCNNGRLGSTQMGCGSPPPAMGAMNTINANGNGAGSNVNVNNNVNGGGSVPAHGSNGVNSVSVNCNSNASPCTFGSKPPTFETINGAGSRVGINNLGVNNFGPCPNHNRPCTFGFPDGRGGGSKLFPGERFPGDRFSGSNTISANNGDQQPSRVANEQDQDSEDSEDSEVPAMGEMSWDGRWPGLFKRAHVLDPFGVVPDWLIAPISIPTGRRLEGRDEDFDVIEPAAAPLPLLE